METANAPASRLMRLRSVAGIAVILAAFAINFALDACVAATVTHTLLGWPPLPMPPLSVIGQNCGHMYQGDMPIPAGRVYDPDQGEACLWRAYTTCHTATLFIDFIGVDAGSSDAITVQPRSGHCTVTDSAQVGVLGPWTTGAVVQCAGLVQERTGGLLVRNCGGHDRLLLPRPPQQVGHVCGALLNNNHAVSSIAPLEAPTGITRVETCFWRAYGSCTHPATLVYQVDAPDMTGADGSPTYSLTVHTLVVQPSHDACALTDAVSVYPPASSSLAHYTCAGLSRTSDGGLVAQACGAEGQVIIPSITSAPLAFR